MNVLKFQVKRTMYALRHMSQAYFLLSSSRLSSLIAYNTLGATFVNKLENIFVPFGFLFFVIQRFAQPAPR